MDVRKKISRIAIGALLAFSFTTTPLIGTTFTLTSSDAFAAETKKEEGIIVKGKVKGLTQKAKMISVDQKDKGVCMIKFNDKTIYKNASSSKDFKIGEAVKITIKKVDAENIAQIIEKLLVRLPEGIKEIKTDELEALIQAKKDYVLIDTRPGPKYKENHIPTAVSIPFSKLKKVAKNMEEGLKLLPFEKNKPLIFYCGGNT